MALSILLGCSRNCKFLSPQVWRNVTTSLSFCTESTTSCLTSVPDLSLSMSLKAFLAALRNSAVNSSSSFRAASARASRSACRAASLAFTAASMAACHSLRSIKPGVVARYVRVRPIAAVGGGAGDQSRLWWRNANGGGGAGTLSAHM